MGLFHPFNQRSWLEKEDLHLEFRAPGQASASFDRKESFLGFQQIVSAGTAFPAFSNTAWYLDYYEPNKALCLASMNYYVPDSPKSSEDRCAELFVLQDRISPQVYNMALVWIFAGYSIYDCCPSRYLGFGIEDEDFISAVSLDLEIESRLVEPDILDDEDDILDFLVDEYDYCQGSENGSDTLPNSVCLSERSVQSMGLTAWLHHWNDLVISAPRPVRSRVMKLVCWEIDVFSYLMQRGLYVSTRRYLSDEALASTAHALSHYGPHLVRDFLINEDIQSTRRFYAFSISESNPVSCNFDWPKLLEQTSVELRVAVEKELCRICNLLLPMDRDCQSKPQTASLDFAEELALARGLSVVDFILQAYSDIEMRFGIKMGIAM